MPLTRKYTKALEKLAHASKRLASAKSKSNALLLDAIFCEDEQQRHETTPVKPAPATTASTKPQKK